MFPVEREHEVSVEDLLGIVDVCGRLLRPIPRQILDDPRGKGRYGWRPWVNELNERLRALALRRRPVPFCHQLGSEPKGYDWSDENKCQKCSLKLSCMAADPELHRNRKLWLRIKPDVSHEAVLKAHLPSWVKNPKRAARALVMSNPYANLAPEKIWDIYPSGMVIPKIYPQHNMNGEARIYKVELHNEELTPKLYVVWVGRAVDVLECLAVRNFLSAERLLEGNWDLWEDIERDCPPLTTSTAWGASGTNPHVQAHVMQDIHIDNGTSVKDERRGWGFWRMTRRFVRRHLYARYLRREGKQFVGTRRIYTECRACSRI